MIYEFNHVALQVRELEPTVEFYTTVLGGQVVFQCTLQPSNTECVYVQIADGLLELLSAADPPPDYKYGFNHVAFMSDDLDGDHERLTAAGHPFAVAPKPAQSGIGRLAFLPDPSGVRIELIERDREFRLPHVDSGIIKSIDHTALLEEDMEAARTFYGKDLAMEEVTEVYLAERKLRMVYLAQGPDMIELAHFGDDPIEGKIAHVGFRVESVDESTEYLRAHGVEIPDGYPALEGTGIGKLTRFRDPEDNGLQIHDRADLRELNR